MAGGRPVKWKTPEEMQVVIDDYFDYCNRAEEKPIPPTVTGLAIALDMTRRTLLDYCEKSDEFSHTINRAKTKVEAYIERRLYEPNATGCIFNLKNNFGWKDKTESEISTPEGKPFEVKNVTDKDLDARIAELANKTGKA